jgi:hypothetical protein
MLYNKQKGLRWSLGPFGQMFISEHHMKTIVLPLLLLLPAIIAALLDNIMYTLRCAAANGATTVGPVCDGNTATVKLAVPQPASTVDNDKAGIYSMFSPKQNKSQPKVEVANQCTRTNKIAGCHAADAATCDIICEAPYSVGNRRGIADWNRILLALAFTKSADLGANLGYYWPVRWEMLGNGLSAGFPTGLPTGGVMGSAASLDIQKFHPIHFLLCFLQGPQYDKLE